MQHLTVHFGTGKCCIWIYMASGFRLITTSSLHLKIAHVFPNGYQALLFLRICFFPLLTFEATHPFLFFSWLNSSVLQKHSFIFLRYQSSITPITEWFWCAHEWEDQRTKVRRGLNVWGMTLICTLNNHLRIGTQDVSLSASQVGEKTLQSIKSLVYTVLNNSLGFFFLSVLSFYII